jgi:integrase
MTDRGIRAATTSVKSGRVRQIELRDDGERGAGRLVFLVRANKAGCSSEFYGAWHRDGRRRLTKLGSYPAMSLADARKKFREDCQPQIQEGRDPTGPRAFRRNVAPTVEDLFEAYIADLEARGKTGADSARSMLLGPNGLAEVIGRKRLASQVTPDDILPHLHAINARGKAHYSGTVRAWARAAFQFALKSRYRTDGAGCRIDWGVTHNPVDPIEPPKGWRSPGQRFLTPTEFRDFYLWLERVQTAHRYRAAAALRLMMVTGQRPQEIFNLSVEHYSSLDREFHWKTTKNKKPHTLPVARQAAEILQRLGHNEHGLYFPRQKDPAEPMREYSGRQLVDKYIAETGAKPFVQRDLRRTFKTLAGRAGISKEDRDRLQNHAAKDVSSKHYDRYDYWREKCWAVERWSQAIDAMLSTEGAIPMDVLASPQPLIQLEARIVPDVQDDLSSATI